MRLELCSGTTSAGTTTQVRRLNKCKVGVGRRSSIPTMSIKSRPSINKPLPKARLGRHLPAAWPDGQYRWFLSRAVPIRNAAGKVMRWFGTNTDISERIQVEAELEQARRQAEAANQAKSDFLANMSHEIRTPMTAILGFADLLKAADDDQREKVETIRRNGQFLLELINDILDLSKIEAGKIEIDMLRFSPSKLVEDVCSLMHVRAVESNLTLKVEFAAWCPM